MKTAWEILAKAAAGGLLVVGFALVAQMLSPKRFLASSPRHPRWR
jgi:hypothetical protein